MFSTFSLLFGGYFVLLITFSFHFFLISHTSAKSHYHFHFHLRESHCIHLQSHHRNKSHCIHLQAQNINRCTYPSSSSPESIFISLLLLFSSSTPISPPSLYYCSIEKQVIMEKRSNCIANLPHNGSHPFFSHSYLTLELEYVLGVVMSYARI